MAAWDNVEGFEFQHDLITPSLDRQAACLSLPGTLQLDHLQPLQPDLDWEFSIFPHTSYWGSPILLPTHGANSERKGNSMNLRNGWDQRVSMPRMFKLDHFQVVKPIWVWEFLAFSLSCWGSLSREKMVFVSFSQIKFPLKPTTRWRAKAGLPLGSKAGWHLAVGLRGNFICVR